MGGVDVEDLVRAQLAHFVDLIGSRITAHGLKLRLKAASAQVIGLALHEFTTNAGKYGSHSWLRSRRCLLGDRQRHPHHELDRARGAARVCLSGAGSAPQ
jgi:hypothetical protein